MKKIFDKKRLLLFLTIGSFILGSFTSIQVYKAITAADINAAGNIAGLSFTKQEVDSLLPGVNRYLENYTANRKQTLGPNDAFPLVFDPKPSGFSIESKPRRGGYTNPGNVRLPKDKEDLAFYTVRQLADLISKKKISSVELTQFFIARLKKFDPELKCVITLTENLAIKQAQQADKEIASGNYKGMLHGIPYGLKDLFATKGYKTTWGATPYKNQQLDYDAAVVEKLREAGAVLVAKLSLGALAMGDVWYGGQTRNPWDPESGSSGSSAGSASAVAAGLVPFAIGTETRGSIVSPSTVCGTTGLRPTFGRVSRYGAMPLSWSMDKIGPICRTAEDCAIVFNAIQGEDPRDPSSVKAPYLYNPMIGLNALKIGYIKSDFEKDYPFKSQDSLTLIQFKRMGINLIPIELPKLPDINFILDAEAAAAFDELTRSGKDDQLVRQTQNAWPNLFRKARMIPAVEYIQANRLRRQLIEDMFQVFQKVDLYLSPSWASSNLSITNLTGHPCVVLPNGYKDGKPTSITLNGQLYEEGEILAVANAFQAKTAFHKKHPGDDKKAEEEAAKRKRFPVKK